MPILLFCRTVHVRISLSYRLFPRLRYSSSKVYNMAAKSWLDISEDSPFSLANIPFGIISKTGSTQRTTAVAVGEHVIDLGALAEGGAFSKLSEISSSLSVFSQPTLNEFAALGRSVHRSVREYLQQLLNEDTAHPELLRDNSSLRKDAVLKASEVVNHLPMKIGDYTDFYAGLNHAYNVGVLFRGPQNALQPNYKHLPVGYHGRASSVVVSGTPIRRPNGQVLPKPGATEPIFSPCKRLDIELELGAFICKPNNMGDPIKIDDAGSHVFGYVLMNDWSARDIQAWEYVPLGPFNAKNFGTTISPWVVLADALEGAKCPTLESENQKKLLPYLRGTGSSIQSLDIALKVDLKVGEETHTVSNSNAKYLLYSMEQMIAHHTSTGCNMNPGDLLGSGTISGTSADSRGSFLEITDGGKTPMKIAGKDRTFLEDGDEIILSGVAGEKGAYVGFGECRGVILPAHPLP